METEDKLVVLKELKINTFMNFNISVLTSFYKWALKLNRLFEKSLKFESNTFQECQRLRLNFLLLVVTEAY